MLCKLLYNIHIFKMCRFWRKMVDDKRTRHTKDRIRSAMITCLETTSPDKITVRQICDIAGINRSTFYAHYPNPVELYRFLEHSMTDGIKRHFNSLKRKKITYKEFIYHFLEYCYENSDLFLVLYKSDDLSIKNSFVDLIESYDYLADTVPENNKTYILEYYVNGVFSVITHWLREDRTKSIDEMTEMLYRLTYKPAKS